MGLGRGRQQHRRGAGYGKQLERRLKVIVNRGKAPWPQAADLHVARHAKIPGRLQTRQCRWYQVRSTGLPNTASQQPPRRAGGSFRDRHGPRRPALPEPAAATAPASAAVRSSDSPYQSGVAVWGPMLTPAAARRASVGASGAPSQHTAGGSADNGTPSGRRNRNCPVGVSYHLKALFVHRAVVEPTAENQVLQPGLPAVGPVHDVVGVAAAGVAAGELALAAIAVQQGAAQGGRDRPRPATDVKHLAVGAVAQRHEGGIAGKAARSLPAQVQTAGLLDDRLTGVQVRWRGCTLAGAVVRLGRCRGNVRRGGGRLTGAGSRLSARGRRGGARCAASGLAARGGNCARQSLEWGEVM